jgi:L-alanine-DL-glutamate epimerase-like enolase superfamily enzyme
VVQTLSIQKLEIAVFTIPTSSPESDGTYEWDSTTLVLVHAHAGGHIGLGYTYADSSTALLIRDKLAKVVTGLNPLDVNRAWLAMVASIRNLGRPGIASMAISAVDTALWDLKAKLLDLPLVKLFGQVRDAIPIYGSGGFTSYTDRQLQDQFRAWRSQSISKFKMKVGRDAVADLHRVRVARECIGPEAELFVDANGGYGRKQALAQAEYFAEQDVGWFEEPVSSDDLDGLRFIRDRAPSSMEIAAGEYGYDLDYFRRMIGAGAVDVLQADATRCAGFTGVLQAATLCDAHHLSLSAHCAPALHVHIGCALHSMRHLEYFHDHVRIEHMLFDGAPKPSNGELHPDLTRAGIGLDFKSADAQRFAA